MGRTLEEQEALEKQIEEAKAVVAVGALYVHHKSTEKIYKVLDIGIIEANDDLCVIYQAQYGKRLTFIRPVTSWLEQVEWNGQTVPRFSRVEG